MFTDKDWVFIHRMRDVTLQRMLPAVGSYVAKGDDPNKFVSMVAEILAQIINYFGEQLDCRCLDSIEARQLIASKLLVYLRVTPNEAREHYEECFAAIGKAVQESADEAMQEFAQDKTKH